MKRIVIFLCILMLLSMTACSIEPAVSHIYDDAEIVDVLSGSGTEVVGKCSVTKAWSKDVTDETMADWYFNHVEPGDYNWAVIVYLDLPGIGVYGNNGIVEKDVRLGTDEDGSYYLESDENAVIYMPSNGKLVEMTDD